MNGFRAALDVWPIGASVHYALRTNLHRDHVVTQASGRARRQQVVPGTRTPRNDRFTPSDVIVGLMVVAFLVWIVLGNKAAEDRFAVGNCLHFEDGKYKGADCDERKARFKVYATKEDSMSCVEVPGASSAYNDSTAKGGARWFCIGDKGVDLAKAINNVDKDDCVVTNESSAEKAACNASGSRPVLKVLKDVLKVNLSVWGTEVCGGKTKLAYSWGLEDDQQNPYPKHSLTWDRVLCLGAQA